MKTNSYISDKDGHCRMASGTTSSNGFLHVRDMWGVLHGYAGTRINEYYGRRYQRSVARVVNARP
jgi:L-rhamnose isomerase